MVILQNSRRVNLQIGEDSRELIGKRVFFEIAFQNQSLLIQIKKSLFLIGKGYHKFYSRMRICIVRKKLTT